MLFVDQDVLVMPYKDPEMERLCSIARYIYIRDNPEELETHRKYNRDFMRNRRLDPEFRAKDCINTAKWREKNPEYGKEYQKQHRHNDRIELLTFLGCKCVKCGYDKDWRGLQIDHINGGGTREERETFNGDTNAMYRYYLKHPEEAKKKLQTLCANCNQIKKYTNYEGVIEAHNPTLRGDLV